MIVMWSESVIDNQVLSNGMNFCPLKSRSLCVLPHVVMDGMMREGYFHKEEEMEWRMTKEDCKHGRRFCRSALLCPPGACQS